MPRSKAKRKTKPKISTLQRRIRELRDDLGMSQATLAEAVGLTDKSTVSHWELGDSSPRSDLLPGIARALKVTIADLYDGKAAA